jgi:hypothetical protein
VEDPSGPILNALILRNFPDAGIFFSWLLRARPAQRYMGLADNFAKIRRVLILRELKSLGQVFGPAVAGGGASFEPNILRRH